MSTSSSDRATDRRNLRRAVICATVGLILFMTLAQAGLAVALFLVPDTSSDGYRQWLVRPDRNDLAAVTFGSSLSLAIDFKALGQPGQHLYLPVMDLHEAAALARTYLTKESGLRFVLLPVAPEVRYQDNAAGMPLVRRRNYGILLAGGLSLIDRDLANMASAYADGAKALRQIPRAVQCLARTGAACVPRSPTPMPDPFEADMVSRMAKRNAENLIRDVAPVRHHAQEAALRDLATTLSGRGIHLILYPPPRSYPLQEASRSEYRQRGWLALEQPPDDMSWARDHAAQSRSMGLCVHWVDNLWDTDTDGADVTNYNDPDHLSTTGAQRFSLRLGRRLADLPPCRPDRP